MADSDDQESRSPKSGRRRLPDPEELSNASEQTTTDSKIASDGSRTSTTTKNSPAGRNVSFYKEDSAVDHPVAKSRENPLQPAVQENNYSSTSPNEELGMKTRRSNSNSSIFRAMQSQQRDGVGKFAYVDDDRRSIEEQREAFLNEALSSQMAAVFMVSVTTGYSISSLPRNLKQSSWFGIFMIILLSINLCYAGICHGWSWTIMEERWPECLEDTRTPYMDMAEKAVGKWMRYIVEIIVNLTHLTTGGALIIVAAGFVSSVTHNDVTFCAALIIASIVLMPFVYLRTYKDLKLLGVLDLVLTLIWVLLVIVSVTTDKDAYLLRKFGEPSYESVALAFSDMSFAFGPGAALPSIMSEMRDRSLFPQASASASFIVVLLYSLPAVLVYASYGEKTPKYYTHRYMLASANHTLSSVMEVVFLFQILITFVLFVLPSMRALEHRFRCPESSKKKRLLIRSSVMLILMLLVLVWPDMGRLVQVIGATGSNLLTFLFPPIFYVILVYQKSPMSTRKRFLSKKEWMLVIEMITVGIAIILLGTFFSVRKAIVEPRYHVPCFMNFTSSGHEGHGHEHSWLS